MAIKVRATKMGYIEHRRIREGEVLMLDEKHCKKDAQGKVILPMWVELAEDKPKKGAKKAATIEEPIEFDDEVI